MEGREPKDRLPLDQYMCHVYLLKEKAKAEKKAAREKELKEKKDKTYKMEVLKEVFGDSYKIEEVKKDEKLPAEAGIVLKKRPDYTQPKDKWRLGNQLKELAKEFPHDRVLQRMIEEEFKNNQLFQYPEEYDIYNKNLETSLKKNFAKEQNAWQDEGGKKFLWKIPNFQHEQTVIENFKKKDIHDKKGWEMMLKKQAEAE